MLSERLSTHTKKLFLLESDCTIKAHDYDYLFSREADYDHDYGFNISRNSNIVNMV